MPDVDVCHSVFAKAKWKKEVFFCVCVCWGGGLMIDPQSVLCNVNCAYIEEGGQTQTLKAHVPFARITDDFARFSAEKGNARFFGQILFY